MFPLAVRHCVIHFMVSIVDQIILIKVFVRKSGFQLLQKGIYYSNSFLRKMSFFDLNVDNIPIRKMNCFCAVSSRY